jgi:hypothetical protein
MGFGGSSTKESMGSHACRVATDRLCAMHCLNVFDHVEDLDTALRTLADALRRGATLVVSVPHPLKDGSGRVAVRHSKHPNDAVIVYTRAEWEVFTAGVRLGEFDF